MPSNLSTRVAPAEQMPALDPYLGLGELIAAIDDVRPLPAVAARILELADGDRFSAHELATAVANDQALTARLLRLANSAYYGYSRRITTVRDAVVLIGFRAVRSATLVSCVMSNMPESELLDGEAFWHHALSVGTLAELLARTEGIHQDHAFTAGVLHNLGLLALDQHRPDLLRESLELAREAGTTRHDAQLERFGWTDAELGGALALHWSFPPPLVAAIRDHAVPIAVISDAHSLTAFVLRARIFARSFGESDGIEPMTREEPPAEWAERPLATALQQAGGVDGVRERAAAFFAAAGR
ncbi:MAG: HDOD domain-containing protein [Dehalococcoidia bacterium]|nr:HDOD domain-containing protein [Dehalococcoidia bacterium]